MNRPLLAVAVAAAAAAVALSLYVAAHLVNPEDIVVERDIQSVDWGPLTATFASFSWIGDAKGFVVEVIILVAVLLLNRPAWIFAAAAPLTGAWYELGIHLVSRPRPTTAQVLRVTEHPGASSYPSGHTIFIVTVTVMVMACLGLRYLPSRAWWAGWLAVAVVVGANAISRMYTGTHWPTDVLGGFLIAVAWLALVGSIRWIGSGLVSANPGRRPAPSAPRSRR